MEKETILCYQKYMSTNHPDIEKVLSFQKPT